MSAIIYIIACNINYTQLLFCLVREVCEMITIKVTNNLVDYYYEKVKCFVMQSETTSLYEIDREFQVGYVVAAFLIDRLEIDGVISPHETCMPRKVLARCNDEEKTI